MVYTRENFKRTWDSDEKAGGITFNDIADCAVAWGISRNPRCCNIRMITGRVLKEAGCKEWASWLEKEEED